MIRRHATGGYTIAVDALLASARMRFSARMQRAEIITWHVGPGRSTDITGKIIIVGGMGVVDGIDRVFSARDGDWLDVVIFELRNVEHFMQSTDMPWEKNKATGKFDDASYIASIIRNASPCMYTGHVKKP